MNWIKKIFTKEYLVTYILYYKSANFIFSQCIPVIGKINSKKIYMIQEQFLLNANKNADRNGYEYCYITNIVKL